MSEREKLIHLLCNVDCNGADRREGGCSFRQDSRCNVIQKLDMCMVETIADHLLANGVMCVDTNTVDVVKNREPLITAFGMPMNELAYLIRAKREGRVIVPPCKVGDIVYVCFSRTRVIECKVAQIIIENIEEIGMSFICYGGMRFDMRHWGKTGFLTRDEAEKALEGKT